MQRLFGAIPVCLLVVNIFAADAADPTVDRAVQDAVKKYPAGDYPRFEQPSKTVRIKLGDAPPFEIHAVAASGEHNRSYIYRMQDGQVEALFLMPEVLLDASSIKSARADHVSNNESVVRITLTGAGAQKFGEMTEKLLNKRIGIVVEGRVVSAPVIRSAIYGGELILTVPTDKEANEMAAKLNP